MANHHLELAALDAIGAAHKRHSRLVGCFWSRHGLVHMRNEVLVVENDVEKRTVNLKPTPVIVDEA